MGRIAGVTPEETKDRLTDAAARVFERNGFEKATVAEIAREAGVSSGAIYAHYPTKGALLADSLRCHGARATAGLFPPGTEIDAAAVLVALTERLTTQRRQDTALLAEALLASRRDAALADVLVDALVEQQRLVAAVVADGQAKGVLAEEVSADVAARFALMLGLGAVFVSGLDMPAVDQADWEVFARRFIGAFTREGTS